jgi:hypothetical protein
VRAAGVSIVVTTVERGAPEKAILSTSPIPARTGCAVSSAEGAARRRRAISTRGASSWSPHESSDTVTVRVDQTDVVFIRRETVTLDTALTALTHFASTGSTDPRLEWWASPHVVDRHVVAG